MPGSLPGIPGVLAFGAVKFGGYILAAEVLKRAQPSITASRYKIAGARTGLGVLIGLPIMLGLTLGLSNVKVPDSSVQMTFFLIPVVLSFLVWALAIHLFTRSMGLRRSDLWKYSVFGAGWSCVLDVLGVALAFVTPGQVPFC